MEPSTVFYKNNSEYFINITTVVNRLCNDFRLVLTVTESNTNEAYTVPIGCGLITYS